MTVENRDRCTCPRDRHFDGYSGGRALFVHVRSADDPWCPLHGGLRCTKCSRPLAKTFKEDGCRCPAAVFERQNVAEV